MNTIKLWFSKEMEEEKARSIAGCAKWICRLSVCMYIFSMVLSISGRQTFVLHSNSGIQDHIRLIDGRNDWTRRGGLITSAQGTFRVFTNPMDEVDLGTRIVLSVANLLFALPFGISFFVLSKFFENIQREQIFVRANVSYLLIFGRIQMVTRLLVPFLIGIISSLANRFTDSSVQYSNDGFIITALAFLVLNVAAYIICYGMKSS
ncbi:MAG: hypothetical protein FWF78_06230 [Defluviitaleaceae bacterium]|nr:hypothetical protein [Defluviitaleaceae bacterium]